MTRTVAERTITTLGPSIAPEDFLKSVTAVPIGADILSLRLTASTDAEAVGRLAALTSTYLDFRAAQLSLQSDVVVDGMNQRIDALQSQVSDLTRRIDELSTQGETGASPISDAVAERAQVTAQIGTLQQSVQDATLQTTSIVSASRVIDPAAAEPTGGKRRIILGLASGLIGGTVIGVGLVLFLAITSDRLRRRFEVAAALEVPVPVSVGRLAPLPPLLRRPPPLRYIDARRADGRQRLAHAIEMALPESGRRASIAVACVDNADEVRFAVATAAAVMEGLGRRVLLIDLTEQGRLAAAVTELMLTPREIDDRPTVLRPRGIPALAQELSDLRIVGHEYEEQVPPPGRRDVTLVLADLDPSVGADHLAVWTKRVVIAVSGGLSSAERVRTAGDLVRAAGLDLRFAVLIRAHVTDESSGVAQLTAEASTEKPEPL